MPGVVHAALAEAQINSGPAGINYLRRPRFYHRTYFGGSSPHGTYLTDLPYPMLIGIY